MKEVGTKQVIVKAGVIEDSVKTGIVKKLINTQPKTKDEVKHEAKKAQILIEKLAEKEPALEKNEEKVSKPDLQKNQEIQVQKEELTTPKSRQINIPQENNQEGPDSNLYVMNAVLYKYVLTNMDVNELSTYIKTLGNSDLIQKISDLLNETNKKAYNYFLLAASTFVKEETQKHEEEHKRIYGANNTTNTSSDGDNTVAFSLEDVLKIGSMIQQVSELAYHEIPEFIENFANEHNMHGHCALFLHDWLESTHEKDEKKPEVTETKIQDVKITVASEKILSVQLTDEKLNPQVENLRSAFRQMMMEKLAQLNTEQRIQMREDLQVRRIKMHERHQQQNTHTKQLNDMNKYQQNKGQSIRRI